MGDHLHKPSNAQTSQATEQALRKSPGDMPDRGGRLGGEAQTSEATHTSLGRKDNPVAAFGAKPGIGETQVGEATQVPLSRKANSPYDNIAKTTPQTDL